MDPVKVYGEELTKYLEDGERLRDAGLCHAAFGDESGLGQPAGNLRAEGVADRTPAPSEGSRTWVDGVDPLWGLEWNAAAVDARLGGVTAAGGADSIAARMLAAIRSTRGSTYYAVTDRRLLLLTRPSIRTFTPLFAVPLAAVTTARHEARWFLPQRGRVVLHFADGSLLALVTGHLFAGRAKALVAALRG
ncbi:MAG TPA: hypothetical protein VF054_10960 [Micromonosporaceae bacterium]